MTTRVIKAITIKVNGRIAIKTNKSIFTMDNKSLIRKLLIANNVIRKPRDVSDYRVINGLAYCIGKTITHDPLYTTLTIN